MLERKKKNTFKDLRIPKCLITCFPKKKLNVENKQKDDKKLPTSPNQEKKKIQNQKQKSKQ